MRLKDRVAIVTGAGQGIGKTIALRLAEEGAKLAIAEINSETAKQTADEIIRMGIDAIAIPTDVSNEDSTRHMAKEAIKNFKKIDILVNNAALSTVLERKYFYEIDEEQWDRVMAINLKGVFLCIKAVFPYMKEQGRGKIINISSATFWIGYKFHLHYVASKGGIIGLTRALAKEIGEYGISVNAITPGLTLTEGIIRKIPEKERNAVSRGQCFKRNVVPQDLTGAVVFLASDDSNFITGQAINIDGGFVTH